MRYLAMAIGCGLACGLGAVSAAAHESTVTILADGQPLVGTLQLAGDEPAPVVLMLHGFTGSRDELATDAVPDGVFAHVADRLEEAGYSSLRIDFRGSGESTDDLSFAETTFEGQITDALAAVDFLQGLDSVNGEDLFVIGWSQGGLVAAAAAGRSDAFDAVALWNAVGDPDESFSAIFGDDVVADAIAASADESINLTTGWGADIELKGAFFDGVASFDPVQEITSYDGPLFVASGSGDTVVLPVWGERYIAAHQGPNELWAADMDHVFNVFATDEMLDALIAQTVDYFTAH